jgi:hypothetical protein
MKFNITYLLKHSFNIMTPQRLTTPTTRRLATPIAQRPPTPTAIDTPNSRQRPNYKTLHNYGLQGHPNSQKHTLDSPSKNALKRTKAIPAKHLNSSQSTIQFDSQLDSQLNSQLDSQLPQSQATIVGSNDDSPQKKSKKHGWFWKYFITTILDSTYRKEGKRKEVVQDQLYTCNVVKGCKFERKASKIHTATTAFTKHLEDKHKITESTSSTSQPTVMAKWVKNKKFEEVQKSFEDALLDWIIYTCQAFTTTESEWFIRMMKAAGCTDKIPKADAIANKIQLRMSIVEKELRDLLDETCLTIALSIDGWTSQNSLPMFAINGTWLSPELYRYRACLDFVEIQGAHSGEKLADIVYNTLKTLNIRQKLIAITADNASNNDTLCRHLFNRLSRHFDSYDSEVQYNEGTMRFKGEESRIRCFAHILNLVVKAILHALGSSTQKDAMAFLDRVASAKWQKITLPGAQGVIARLRIVVLWIARSPQRIQDWDKRSKRAINYDGDTRWNSTFRMIKDAEHCRRALEETIESYSELEPLKLTQAHWEQLRQIRKVLTPFSEYTDYISKEQPTIQTSAMLYRRLEDMLLKITSTQDEYAVYDKDLIDAVKVGYDVFKGYNSFMKGNDIYLLATILDPRIKTQWIKNNLAIDAETIVNRLRTFLRTTYPPEVELPSLQAPEQQKKSIQYSILEEFQSTTSGVASTSDIDRYFDTPPVHFRLSSEDQTQWILNYWNTNKYEYPSMFQAVRDYLPIPGSEVDVERLFNTGRDMLGIRRFSMSGNTLRTLMMLKDTLRVQEESTKNRKNE